MRLNSVPRALFFAFFLLSKADASANATASPARPGTFPSTANDPGTLLSAPPNARDEERVSCIEDFGLGIKLETLLTKSKQAVMDSIVYTQLVLKLGWWTMRRLHPSIVYTNLKLDQVKENILSNVWFRAWVTYVDSYNANNPEEKVSIIRRLRWQFFSYKLAMMLDEAKEEADPSVRALGTRLLNELMEGWKNSSFSLEDIYSLLQSDPRHPTLLTDRTYKIWNTYLSEYFPGRLMKPFNQLLHTFTYSSLSSLLIASKQSKETATLATAFQLKLEKEWLWYDVAPEVVFKYLMLDEDPYNVLGNRELASWMRYAKMYREKTGQDVTLAQVLVNLFKTDIIEDLIRTAESEEEKKLAEKLKEKLAEKLKEKLAEKLKEKLAEKLKGKLAEKWIVGLEGFMT